MGIDWSQRGNSWVCVGPILLICGIALYILPHTLCWVKPPEFRGDQLVGLKVTRVAGSLVIMATSEDGMAEGVLRVNIHTSFVSEDVVIILPVRQTRPEGDKNVF